MNILFKTSFLKSSFEVLLVCLLSSWIVAASNLNAAETNWTPPRTEHGHPDFQGVWMLNFLTPLERPEGVQNLIITPEEARVIASADQFQLPEVAELHHPRSSSLTHCSI